MSCNECKYPRRSRVRNLVERIDINRNEEPDEDSYCRRKEYTDLETSSQIRLMQELPRVTPSQRDRYASSFDTTISIHQEIWQTVWLKRYE